MGKAKVTDTCAGSQGGAASSSSSKGPSNEKKQWWLQPTDAMAVKPSEAAKVEVWQKHVGATSPEAATSVLPFPRTARRLIHPNCWYMQQWDTTVSIALFFTGIVTPYEVAFLSTEFNGIFVINRCIDFMFIKDMVMQFFLMYEESSRKGRQLVRCRRKIVRRYVKGWFFIDLLSIIPFDVLNLVFHSPAFQRLKVLRTVRVMRLLKLARVLRASRILKRWEASMSVSYAYLAMCKFGVLMWISAHWGACCWGLCGRIQEGDGPNWIQTLRDNKGGPEDNDLWGLYWACLHFALMTLTSIGYGDIYPMNTMEYVVCCFLMACGGVSWAYIIGNFCGIIATLNIQEAAFRQTMDDLNYMMDERGIPHDMRRRLRTYFHLARDSSRTDNYRMLMDRMSPMLQVEVARITNQHWICKVWYFCKCSEQFMAHLALALQSKVFVQSEEIRLHDSLAILTRGMVARKGRVHGNGAVWGEELLISSQISKLDGGALALTFTELQLLSRAQVDELLAEFPADAKLIRKKVVRWLCVQRLLAMIRESKAKQDAGVIERLARCERGSYITHCNDKATMGARLTAIEGSVKIVQQQMDLLVSSVLKELSPVVEQETFVAPKVTLE